MSIEARGAKHAYVYAITANRIQSDGIIVKRTTYHYMMFDVANSDDEATGRAMRAAHASYPERNGWTGHYATFVKVSGIDWVGPFDFDKIEPKK